MFAFKLLKNNAGILLCGDYSTLHALNEVVHQVADKSILIKSKEDGMFLGLAYDARKAYERQRQIIEPDAFFPEVGVRYGVEILWPVLLVQCRLLRASLAYFDSTKTQQAITFALESVIEAAIDAAFGTNAKLVLERWYRIDPAHLEIEDKLMSRGAQFCYWTSKERKAGLAGLLTSFDPMYTFIYEQSIKAGIKGLVAPDVLDAYEDVEWPDPKW